MSSSRDSVLSASSGYPSSLSSLSMSALGLTDSPLPQRHRKSPSVSSSPSSSPTRQRPVRATPSKASLRQEVTTNAAAKAVHQQRSAESVHSSHQKRPSQSGMKENQNQGPLSARVVSASKRSPAKADSKASAPRAAQTSTQVAQPDARAMSRSSAPRKTAPLAGEWEAQLVRDASRLSLGTTPRAQAQEEPPHLSEADKEWERMGQAMSYSREREDQARREISRAVALPPPTPRTPIRAVVNGVTSIHVGVRPRLHPSRESESMMQNQPDFYSPAPFFSPVTAKSDLPASSSDVSRHGAELLQKAQKEYEEWKARKEEREGGMETGSRDWKPKTREIATPSALSSYNTSMVSPDAAFAAQGSYLEQHHPPAPAPAPAPTAQPRSQTSPKRKSSGSRPSPTKGVQRPDMPSSQPNDMVDETQAQAMMADSYMQQYPHDPYAYPYWDPSYWWGMYGGMDPMDMQNMQGGHYAGAINDQASTNPELEEQQAYDM